MQFQHKSHNKQQNKPHSHKKKPTAKRQLSGKSQAAFAVQTKESRLNYHKQLQDKKRQELFNKRRGISDSDPTVDRNKVKIVVLLPLNEFANVKELQNDLATLCKGKSEAMMGDTTYFPALSCPPECSSGIPGAGQNQRFIFVPTSRNDYAIMDAAKVADIICVVLSCKGTDYSNVKLDPDKYCHAIDELGYKHINMLRAQGIPTVVGALQHLEELPNKKQNMVKKFFQRYFESEFDSEEKFFVVNKKEAGGNYEATLKHMLRHFASTIPKELSWRKHRSYFVVDKYKYVPEEDTMEAFGYVNGNHFTTQLPIYVTGYGMYLLNSIESEEDPLKAMMMDTKRREEIKGEPTKIIEIADPTKQESLVFENPPDLFSAEQTWPTKEELKEAKRKVKLKTITENPKEEMELEDMESESEKSEPEVGEAGPDMDLEEYPMSEHESDKEESDEEEKENDNIPPASAKHKKLTTLQERSEQDLEFPDEVDVPADQEAKIRFQRYKGLKSIKSTKWDPYENLPPEYARLFEFKSPAQSRKLAISFSEKNGLKLAGMYAKFSIKGLKPEVWADHPKDVPIIVSTLMRHETKVTTLHFRLMRTYEDQSVVQSKDLFEFHSGFKRTLARPIFSEHSPYSYNHRMLKFFRHGSHAVATIFGLIQYPPSQVCMFRKKGLNEIDLIAHGSLMSLDPKRINLKRILLTGNPHKINKRRSVVRYMFFNPTDVKYFRPIDIFTRKGLRGNIIKPIGTHGVMKCSFNDIIQHDDTVCLPLYKRVYPPWIPASWTVNVSGFEKVEPELAAFKWDTKKVKEENKEEAEQKMSD